MTANATPLLTGVPITAVPNESLGVLNLVFGAVHFTKHIDVPIIPGLVININVHVP